jgi:hypothetical protein
MHQMLVMLFIILTVRPCPYDGELAKLFTQRDSTLCDFFGALIALCLAYLLSHKFTSLSLGPVNLGLSR